MPYARNADLPANVRNPLPDAAQTMFRRVVNAALDRGDSEEAAFRQAWAAVSEQYEKPEDGGKWVHKSGPRTLYVKRNVINAAEIIEYFKEQGFETTLQPHDLHVTVMYSKAKVEWPESDDDRIVIQSARDREVTPLGGGGAVVQRFYSKTLTRRWQELCDHGCSYDWPEYKPHVTITWNAGDLDLTKVSPYTGEIVLGPEIFEELDEDWKSKVTEKAKEPLSPPIRNALKQNNEYRALVGKLQEELERVTSERDNLRYLAVDQSVYIKKLEKELTPLDAPENTFHVVKFNKRLGLVFGWAIVSKVAGQEYYDLQGDHIPEDAMLEAALDFMENKRTMKIMHEGKERGKVVFAWPLTEETAKAMGIKSSVTGLMIAVKPNGDELIQAVEDGIFTGFSIGGQRLIDEEVD